MLSTDETCLLIIDVQEKLAHAMYDSDFIVENLTKMIHGAQLLHIPMILTEQVNLGPTIPDLAHIMDNKPAIEKRSFSCCGENSFMETLAKMNRTQVLIGGIECHICVYQTAMDLAAAGHDVHILADCVSSRTAMNRTIGLDRMTAEGIKLTSTEMALFELLKVAEGENIRALSRLVK